MRLKSAKIKTLHRLSCPAVLQFGYAKSKFNTSVTVGQTYRFLFSVQKHHESIYEHLQLLPSLRPVSKIVSKPLRVCSLSTEASMGWDREEDWEAKFFSFCTNWTPKLSATSWKLSWCHTTEVSSLAELQHTAFPKEQGKALVENTVCILLINSWQDSNYYSRIIVRKGLNDTAEKTKSSISRRYTSWSLQK